MKGMIHMRRLWGRGISSLLAVLAAASLMGGCESKGDSLSADEILIDEIDDEAEEIFADDIEEIFGDDDSAVTEFTFGTVEISGEITDKTESASDDSRNSGKILHIVCWNEDFIETFKSVIGTENLPDGVEVEFTMLSSGYDWYVYDLQKVLLSDRIEPVDMFVTEFDYCRIFNDSDLTLPLSEAGITSEDTAMMFPYTVELGTSSEGILKSVSYQAETGAFAYRRDIALEVFGNDDPDYIHQLITNDFEGTAEALAEKGYYIIPSAWEAFRPYSHRRSMPWIDENGNLTIDPMLKSWAVDMRNFWEKNYIRIYEQWSVEWCDELTTKGKTFGTFFSSWGSEYVLEMYDSYEDGDNAGTWGVCVPPNPYFWGGNFLNISANTDNLDLCGEILKKFISDEEALTKYSVKQRDFCNNRSAMRKVIDSGEAYNDFLAQNTFETYYQTAEEIHAGVEYSSEYDIYLEAQFQWAMRNFIYGNCTYEEAEEMFLDSVSYIFD